MLTDNYISQEYSIRKIVEALTTHTNSIKKRLKISKRISEPVNRKRTDNALTKQIRPKGQTVIYKT
jgi:hypothetical protein